MATLLCYTLFHLPFFPTHTNLIPNSSASWGGGGGGGGGILVEGYGGLHGLGLVIECYHIDIGIHVCSLPLPPFQLVTMDLKQQYLDDCCGIMSTM